MSSLSPRRGRSKPLPDGRVDQREALFNDGATGPASEIQVPAERITRLLGMMIDLDPDLLIPDNSLFRPMQEPHQFLDAVAPVLERHPLTRHAEVRHSGRGLHLILQFDPAVELESAADQQWWAVLVRAVQSSLPSDPNAPGITSLTRPIGSVNSRSGRTVKTLRPGTPISPQQVIEYVDELANAPFRCVVSVLVGGESASPCPICGAPDSRLGVLDRVGQCYSCGRITLEQIYDAVLVKAARPATTSSRSVMHRPAASTQPCEGKAAATPSADQKRRKQAPKRRRRTSRHQDAD